MASLSNLSLSLPSHLPHLAPLSPSFKPSRQFLCCSSATRHSSNAQNSTLHSPTGGSSELRVLFAAGGTGGHISPAVAIADELKLLNRNARILFVGTPNSMESTAIASAGYEFASISAVQLARPVVSPQNLFLPYRLMKSIIQSNRHLRNFNPHIVIGTGGYVSFPTCLAAAIRGIKLVIQEQNAVPGIANWILSFLADQIFVAYNSTIEGFPKSKKCVVCGNPVRLSLRKLASKGSALSHFFPKAVKEGSVSGAKVVLILGGSFGASVLNVTFLNMYSQLLLEKDNLFFIWQTGVQAIDEMESLVKPHPHVYLAPFLHSMDLAYAAADLIVSRAGAMTCSEILAMGKPCILIPSPNVAEGHQFRNASLMADLAGSRVISEDELDSLTLKATIEEILEDEKMMEEMSERALKAAKPNASAEIAERILSLVELSTAPM
ncbi:Glycosyl transferase, family 28, C-terminal [Dillenia turbinata]|uniref:Glycosyl transferase, family 28, C-terminal n=1 Tax=Dillenia turbinata TaxID=194707 RepID=A0AAN8UYI3_9MAGN